MGILDNVNPGNPQDASEFIESVMAEKDARKRIAMIKENGGKIGRTFPKDPEPKKAPTVADVYGGPVYIQTPISEGRTALRPLRDDELRQYMTEQALGRKDAKETAEELQKIAELFKGTVPADGADKEADSIGDTVVYANDSAGGSIVGRVFGGNRE